MKRKRTQSKIGQRSQLASSRLLASCATLVALFTFLWLANQTVAGAMGIRRIDPSLTTALLLNIAIILLGWRRAKDLEQALEDAQSRSDHFALHVALTDSVTGLANRRQLMTSLSDLLRERADGVLLLLDLDFFKNVNDLYGHCAGDQVLKQVAKIIASSAPKGACCARLGGDEFAVILRDASPASTDQITRKITTEVARPLSVENAVVHVSASIGLSLIESGMGPEDILRRSDIAMYAAKRAGRNCSVWFDREMEKELIDRTQLEREIRSGIAAAEFIPYFQPQISLTSGELTGFEVLARWNSPARGLLLPDSFMAAAEGSGLIGALSLSVMKQALVEARDWPTHLKIAVNVSPVQFRDPKLAERILKVLTEANFPPPRLEIEITETALVEDRDMALAIVESLKNVGITISLDDFGTGYASLSQLQSLPFDRIKIDKSFVAALLADPQSSAIVNSITTLGKALHLPITAEGVETGEIKDELSAMGCAEAQGWLFGKAVCAEAIRELLKLTPHGVERVDPEVPQIVERRDNHRRAGARKKAAR
ncbi:MAG: putative bifunctional diguanylate cyclase/phosphodiesterase [Sphingomicrobium sp.]